MHGCSRVKRKLEKLKSLPPGIYILFEFPPSAMQVYLNLEGIKH